MVDRTLTAQNNTKHPVAVRFAIGAWPKLFILDREGILREEGDRERLEQRPRR